MKVLIVCFTFLISSLMMGQNDQEIITKALNAYENKEYQVAIAQWEKLLKDFPNNADIHYNIANAYYQNRQAGLSIFHYEKALKIKPDLQQAQINLEFAQKLKIDKFKGNYEISQSEIFYTIFDFLSPNNWAILTILLSVLTLIAFVVYYFSSKTTVKKSSFVLMFVFLVLMIVSLGITYKQNQFLNTSQFGIIVPKEVLLKEQPRVTSKTLLKVHEGCKVLIKERTDQWVYVTLVNDTLGWVKKDELKEL